MTNADKLVKKLHQLSYVMHGVSFEILRYHGQPMMNKALGEYAPTWELLANPLWHALTQRIIVHGTHPVVTLPHGTTHGMQVCSHIPLTHILRQPLVEWTVYEDARVTNRLVIETQQLPTHW